MKKGDCDEEFNTLLGEISHVTIVAVSSPGKSSGDGPSRQLISSDSPRAGGEVGDDISLSLELSSIGYLASAFEEICLNGTSQLLNANVSKCEENTPSSTHSSFDPSTMPGNNTTRPESVTGDHYQHLQRYQGSSASMHLNGETNNFFEAEQAYQGSSSSMHLHGATDNFFEAEQAYQGSSSSMHLHGATGNIFECGQRYQGSSASMHLNGGTNSFFQFRQRYQGSSASTCLNGGTNRFFEPRVRYQGSSTSTYLNGGTDSFFEPTPSASTPGFEFPSSSWGRQQQQNHHRQLNALSPGYVPYSQQQNHHNQLNALSPRYVPYSQQQNRHNQSNALSPGNVPYSQQHQLEAQSWLFEYERSYRNYFQQLQNQSARGVIGRGNPGLQIASHMTIPQQQETRQINPFNNNGNLDDRMYNYSHPSLQSNNLGRGLLRNSDLSKRNTFIERSASIDSIIQKLDNLEMDPNGLLFNESREFVDLVFTDVIRDVLVLMTNSSGYQLVEKLVQVCREEQLTQIVFEISMNSSHLFKLACDRLGTHIVKRIIKTVRTAEQYHLISSSLKHHLLPLIKDNNGILVVELCIHRLPPPYRKSFLEPAVVSCVEIAKDKRGCCFLQEYIHVLDDNQKRKLLSAIAAKAFELSQHPYGNYVMQYIMEQENMSWAIASILDHLQGHYRAMSLQKHSSNVVEKCMLVAEAEAKSKIIEELIDSAHIREIALDQYGNYVIQSAFVACKKDGALRAAFLKAVKPHVQQLGSSHYGKNVLQRIKNSRKR